MLAVRIGWVRPGPNRPQDIPRERGPWFRLMWLSNRDFCQLMECCIVADPPVRFGVINGMSPSPVLPVGQPLWDRLPVFSRLGSPMPRRTEA